MNERRNRNRFQAFSPELERRELLSTARLPLQHAEVAAHGGPRAIHATFSPVPNNLFHRHGVNGLVLHKAFVNQLNLRTTISAGVTQRVDEAFQVFAQNALHQPILIAGAVSPTQTTTFGQPPAPETLNGQFSLMRQQVDLALQRLKFASNSLTPSQVTSIHFSPVAGQSLIPFANQQLTILQAEFDANPPTFEQNGKLADPTPLNQLNTTYNAILNAIAEFTDHPTLFQEPSDYYINPTVQFKIGANAAPASAGAGFLVRGPGGVFLPGAILHPHIPLS